MTLGELESTGELSVKPQADNLGCSTYPLTSGGQAYYSTSADRVTGINFGPGMRTPEGIAVGASKAAVEQAYASAEPLRNGGRTIAYEVVLGPTATADITLDQTDKVSGITMYSKEYQCADF